MRRLRLSLVLVTSALASLGVIVSCVGDDAGGNTIVQNNDGGSSGGPDGSGSSSGGNDGGGDGAVAAGPLSLTPPRPRVPRNGEVQVEAVLDRKGITGDVTITLAGLPKDVVASGPITIPAAASKVSFTLKAATTSPMGAAPITVTAAGAGELKTEVVVAGTPGQADESFDGDGIILDTVSATAGYLAVLGQSDGKTIIAGGTAGTGSGTWIVKRFDASGKADDAFNTEAAKAMPTTGAARGLAIDPANGKILVVGGSGATEQLTVVRLLPTGAVDQAFANAGRLVADTVSHGQGSRGNALVVRADGSIVVAGKNGTLGLVEGFTAKGDPDQGFVRYETANAAELVGIVTLKSGAYLTGGTDFAASPDAQLAVRLLANGTPDATMGGAAGRTYASGCRGYGFAVTSGGDGVLVGDDQTAPALCATRFDGSGTGTLRWTVSTSAGSNGQFLGAAAAFTGDMSYSTGHAGGSQDRYATVERRLPDGGADPTFGTAGELRIEDVAVPDTYRYVIRASAPGADGRLLVAGTRTGTVSPGAFVARIWE